MGRCPPAGAWCGRERPAGPLCQDRSQVGLGGGAGRGRRADVPRHLRRQAMRGEGACGGVQRRRPGEERAGRERQAVRDRDQVQRSGPAGQRWGHHDRLVGRQRRARQPLAHDERAREVVPDPLGPGRQQRGQGPHHPGGGPQVDEHHGQGPHEAVPYPDRPTVVAHHPQAHHDLAQGPAAGQRLDQGGPPDDDKHQRGQGDGGLGPGAAARAEHPVHEHAGDQQQGEQDGEVDGQGQDPRRQAGDPQLQGHCVARDEVGHGGIIAGTTQGPRVGAWMSTRSWPPTPLPGTDWTA